MSNIISSRAFSLPKKFYQENFETIQKLNNHQDLISIFDNNRYVSRDKIKLINLNTFELKLFNYDVKINYKAMVHSSNNVVIVAEMNLDDQLSIDEMDIIIDNWIPKEKIFSYKERKLHIRNILNFGFLLFISRIISNEVSFNDYL